MTVTAGCRSTPSGSMPGTGSANRTHSPRSPLVAQVIPPSASDRCAGPAVFTSQYGPVTVVEAMFERGLRTHHGPNRTTSSAALTRTHAVGGAMPNGRPSTWYRRQNRNGKVCTVPGFVLRTVPGSVLRAVSLFVLRTVPLVSSVCMPRGYPDDLRVPRRLR
ncbi:hypothetical protein INP57_20620 [Saccharopolyspora sp. HNM0986]|uniref:hypothetical protein n=1 Tax=Saccharopolyspora galaxeae TaxID=2781241 RepID=UPI00190A6BC2|nr:hypothetical protein [Saccharopolyspora sp. HNM0986]MBK0869218.1 hypothetical protein [Saccharopolyspora sp. HNM0986]